jgi:hypothetical protein
MPGDLPPGLPGHLVEESDSPEKQILSHDAGHGICQLSAAQQIDDFPMPHVPDVHPHRRIRIVDVEPFQHGPDGVRLGRLPQGQRAYEALLVQVESLSLGEGVAILGRRHPPALNCSICAINRLLSAFAAAYMRPT